MNISTTRLHNQGPAFWVSHYQVLLDSAIMFPVFIIISLSVDLVSLEFLQLLCISEVISSLHFTFFSFESFPYAEFTFLLEFPCLVFSGCLCLIFIVTSSPIIASISCRHVSFPHWCVDLNAPHLKKNSAVSPLCFVSAILSCALCQFMLCTWFAASWTFMEF